MENPLLVWLVEEDERVQEELATFQQQFRSQISAVHENLVHHSAVADHEEMKEPIEQQDFLDDDLSTLLEVAANCHGAATKMSIE